MPFEQLPDIARDLLARGALLLAVIAGLWLLRAIVVWLLTRPLVSLAARAGMPQADIRLRAVVAAPVQIAFIALAVLVIGQVLGLDEGGALFVSRLARTFVVFALALALYRLLEIAGFSHERLLALTGISIDEALLPFVRVGLQFIVIAFAVVIIVQEWGYDVSALVAGLGLGGLAFSLAASDTIANLFGFSMIVGDRPFVVGDRIRMGDVEGVVERVGLRSTRIRQPDQALVTIPNRTIANSVIMNWSRLGKRYINFTLRLSADARPEDVQRVVSDVRGMLEIRPRVETDSIIVRFTGFGDSWLEVLVRCYVLIADWNTFVQEREAINLAVMRILAETFARSGVSGSVTTTDKLPPPMDEPVIPTDSAD